MLDSEIVTRRDLMIARAIEAQENAACYHWYASNCLNTYNWSESVDRAEYLKRAADWQNTAKLAHEVQSECVQCLLHLSEDWLDQAIPTFGGV
jgi:hypothetical protein